mmetsp:Transcript_67891/g.189338  ORF Transcript_67891/g.189338 Transcript_67891/m.189338 type:complete len:250 (+) Transcript_67891:277-1026(+)
MLQPLHAGQRAIVMLRAASQESGVPRSSWKATRWMWARQVAVWPSWVHCASQPASPRAFVEVMRGRMVVKVPAPAGATADTGGGQPRSAFWQHHAFFASGHAWLQPASPASQSYVCGSLEAVVLVVVGGACVGNLLSQPWRSVVVGSCDASVVLLPAGPEVSTPGCTAAWECAAAVEDGLPVACFVAFDVVSGRWCSSFWEVVDVAVEDGLSVSFPRAPECLRSSAWECAAVVEDGLPVACFVASVVVL